MIERMTLDEYLAATMLDSHVPELPWINADFPMDSPNVNIRR